MLHAIDVVLSAHSLWVDVVVTVVCLLTCVRVVCVVVIVNCGRILFSILYILSPSESWSYLTILSILLSFSVVKSISGGRNHLKSHARAAFCFVKTQNFVVFWRRMQTDRQTDRQTNRQTDSHTRVNTETKFVYKQISTNIDQTFYGW